MTLFKAVTDETLVAQIEGAQRRLVFVAPGITKPIAVALGRAHQRSTVSVSVILDSDQDAYRVGFGDIQGLVELGRLAKEHGLTIRKQSGLRLGLVVADDIVTIWSPTPRSVEGDPEPDEPNGIVLQGDVAATLETAVDGSPSTGQNPEIGTEPLLPEERQQIVEELKQNPPAPFDLSQKTRVFSTRFQFVECEVQGAEWTHRKMKISSLLLNADLPEHIKDILDTQIRPYQAGSDLAIQVQSFVAGQIAYSREGEPLLKATTQADLDAVWRDITKRYLVKMKGFGWLIRKAELEAFRAAADDYAGVLRMWVASFREEMQTHEEELIAQMVDLIKSRIEGSRRRIQVTAIQLDSEVRKGLERMRVIEPSVRIVTKDVSWESTRDQEFSDALRQALPPAELEGWFEEFIAVKASRQGSF